ncbi:FAD:protein FMN transferase [Paraglaciecola aquimarina]|uniref:FAD:protein FMN transferase n=1 Tax=Paraglaciecola algarum TaxID=3050085 RepID=A0ABS9D7U0_9ALTE|nr:FAD:protein FMN transferase [Paraglaciecola sp. G1-23]MCF2948452.1 FAD:protein FMN transferase [Paraglaciecola sp. G1-23]
MGSPCALSLYCESKLQFEDLIAKSLELVNRLEDTYSRFKPESLLSKVNSAAGSDATFPLDDECWQLFNYADSAYKISDGLFDVTSGVLRQVWDFKSNKLPPIDKLEAVVALVGWHKIKLQQDSFSLPHEGMELDLGGIVKEYAADLLASTLRLSGCEFGLVDMAGDIAVVGPHPDHSPWNIAISNPAATTKAIATIPLMSGGLASSGDYERFIMLDGERHSHILNPKTGMPVKGLAGVSVWAPKCVIAGTIATVAMLKGDLAKAWLIDVDCNYLAIDQNGQLDMKN